MLQEQKTSHVNSLVPEGINAGEKGRAERRDWPSSDAASWLPCSTPERPVAQSSSLCTLQQLCWGFPSQQIMSGQSSRLGSWMRLLPSHITKAVKLL